MRKADTQLRRQLVEHSAQNHRDNAKLRFRRHTHSPRHHVLRHALRRQHVPGMNQHRRALIRAVMQKGHNARIIKIVLSNVITDLHAEMAGANASAQFFTRRVDILQRNLAQ